MCSNWIKSLARFTFLLTGLGWAQNTADFYLSTGRAALFSGAFSGIRQAAEIFQQAYENQNCSDCAGNREIAFFHAISRIGLWIAKQDGQYPESGLELAQKFGVSIQSDIVRDNLPIQANISEDRYGRPILPSDLQQLASDLRLYLDEALAPEADYVLAVLNTITQTAAEPFAVYLSPDETAVFFDPDTPILDYDIVVDFGDVLLLKGGLAMIKAMALASSPYDVVLEGDYLAEKVYEKMFSIQNDFLLPNPDFLKILPTANDASDGKAILLEVKQAIIEGLEYYAQAIDYLIQESQSNQMEHHLFTLASEDISAANKIRQKMLEMVNSLRFDATFAIEGDSQKVFDLDSESKTMELEFTVDPLGRLSDGYLYVSLSDGFIDFWTVDFQLENNRLIGYAEEGYGYLPDVGWFDYASGYFEALIDESLTQITNGSLDYWGWNWEQGQISGRWTGFSGLLASEENDAPLVIDPNPIFGGSSRYPQPVHPRDLLCDFGKWNKPIPGTFGNGLGNDPTLGGILPLADDAFWQDRFDPYPSAQKQWGLIQPWQIVSGWPVVWLDEQLVFEDQIGDVKQEWQDEQTPEEWGGLDIDRVYMGFGWTYLYGAIMLAESPSEPEWGNYFYRISLSPSFVSKRAPGSFFFDIWWDGQEAAGEWLLLEKQDGEFTDAASGSIDVWFDGAWIVFRIPLMDLPVSLSGRYFSVDALAYDVEWPSASDANQTHIQLGATAVLAGQVSYPDYQGGPIFLRAVADPSEPEKTLISYTAINGPGIFQLKDVGLGIKCYLQAFCPLFGDYHPLYTDAIKVSTSKFLDIRQQTVSGILLELKAPKLLKSGVSVSGQLSALNPEAYFAFDAIEGALYAFELEPLDLIEYQAEMVLLDRNGSDAQDLALNQTTNAFEWTCPVNGRYYIKLSKRFWEQETNDFQLQMNSDRACPAGDISGSPWAGVRDCRVDINDFAFFANYWLRLCQEPYWCQGADVTQNGRADLEDLIQLAQKWLSVGN